MERLLPENLDISTVLDSTNLYKNWLSEDSVLLLDASNVKRVDAAGIQALTSLFLTAKLNQTDIQLLRPTELLLDSFKILGLTEQLEINH
ncbi:STAS domain-containing protein [Vibrio sp. JPW-9-11-11]|uniref:STAS domain-containing protein n=1 Tax=Vibrio sp. JPW-9-11-11 TaxID=1416532 RepID=UPI0015948101|nr:STAS domain-containing protein [Vibrio sp. JPW-9-11-11]NVD08632.1 STAS domain-containing protein [Vibrio sp. JPW-9-11-11]